MNGDKYKRASHGAIFTQDCSCCWLCPTVRYELKRGTPAHKKHCGRTPCDLTKRGRYACETNRQRSRQPYKIQAETCEPFIQWMAEKIRHHRWSIDACVGYAKRHALFPSCTKTIYTMLWRNMLPISLFELPKILTRRKRHESTPRKNKRILGRNIEECPEFISRCEEFGHWEADTVVGRKQGSEVVVFTAVEKKYCKYIALKMSSRTCAGTGYKTVEELFWRPFWGRFLNHHTGQWS